MTAASQLCHQAEQIVQLVTPHAAALATGDTSRSCSPLPVKGSGTPCSLRPGRLHAFVGALSGLPHPFWRARRTRLSAGWNPTAKLFQGGPWPPAERTSGAGGGDDALPAQIAAPRAGGGRWRRWPRLLWQRPGLARAAGAWRVPPLPRRFPA